MLRYEPSLLVSLDGAAGLLTPMLLLSVLVVVLCLYSARDRWSGTAMVGRARVTVGLAALLLSSLAPVMLTPGRPRRVAYLAALPWCLALAWILDACREKLGRMASVALALLVLVFGVTTLNRNQDWKAAGELEYAVARHLSSLAVSRECKRIVVDVPNLVGDALFFHSRSAERWVYSNTGQDVNVMHAYEQSEDCVAPECCSFHLMEIVAPVESADPSRTYYRRGRNWLTSPPRPAAPQ